jgi:hypothetical protein
MDNPNQEPIEPIPAEDGYSTSRSEARQQRREERREARAAGSGAWVGGAILILLGVVFLLQNLSGYRLENWWALFILIPAFGAYANAWRMYQAEGALTAGVRGSLFSALMMTLVAAIFLFGLSWSLFGPVLLLLIGFGLLIGGFSRR